MFLREAVRSVRSVASLVPSSGFLCRKMLSNIDFSTARTIVELGPGTGVVTEEILARMRADARLYAIEINPVFARHLRGLFDDPRLIVVEGSALELSRHLAACGAGAADAVISSLGLSCMEHAEKTEILRQARRCLKRTGVLNQYQYFPGELSAIPLPFRPRESCTVNDLLRRMFRRVEATHVLRNCPPARVYLCSR